MIFNVQDELIDSVGEAIDEMSENLSAEAMNRVINQIKNAMPGLIELMTYQTQDTWRTMAGDAGGWGDKYAKIVKADFDGKEGNVYLDETMMDSQSKKPNFMFAMMMENGVASWSIKDALMKSDKAKTGKDGIKYITIPLPVATPRKTGSGHKMSYFGGREMSGEIHKLVKAGGKAPEGSTVNVTTMRGSKDVDISGLAKYTTQQRHSQYGIFRRVSEKSKGWQYPNVSTTPIFDSVIKYVEKRMAEVVADFCYAIVEDNK